ncbi:uncharacterized protein PHALS_11949 [Plasmopara halstedii]|uniref:Uncharacterized protein n=1 Tax=Plasmopara halstedii TaxID=4781 RepID=A0A0P1AJS7_PLAHL|nr:uncharacterized protein PHALS_11949 [Plasmopara halstedii]CEG41615.1 hypothetical protein PHALS_11949 [Plasmopara halstedii]|eukprot:XP_024577984.1 hypothetical protein PHALS_11949 [Plasmopara halstedii]
MKPFTSTNDLDQAQAAHVFRSESIVAAPTRICVMTVRPHPERNKRGSSTFQPKGSLCVS